MFVGTQECHSGWCAKVESWREGRSLKIPLFYLVQRRRAFRSSHVWNSAAIGALLFCFAIVISPSQFFLRLQGGPAPVSSSGLHEIHVAAAGSPDRSIRHSESHAPVPEPSRGPLTQGQAQLASAAEGPSSIEEAVPDTSRDTASPVPRDDTSTENPKRNLLDRAHAQEVQQRLFQLGYLSVSATGVWGPLSRQALRSFKADHDLGADERWDAATERTLFSDSAESAESFVGIWGADASACSPRLNRDGLLPAVIDGDGAWAGETFCAFQSKKQTADGWNVVASCTNVHDRWIANVRLVVNGNRLTWTSPRGSQSYVRCKRGSGVARAS